VAARGEALNLTIPTEEDLSMNTCRSRFLQWLGVLSVCLAASFTRDVLAQAAPTAREQAIQARLKNLFPAEVPATLRNPPRQPVVGIDAMKPDELLRALGHEPLRVSQSDEKATVYDDGIRRLRVPKDINGAFKWTDRQLITLAGRRTASLISPEVAATTVRERLAALGIPAGEVWRINPRTLQLDVADATADQTVFDAPVGHIINVKRQVNGFPVLGSECQVMLEQRGEVSWMRCRWPTFVMKAAGVRSLDAALRGMSAQIDASLHSSRTADTPTISAGFVYAERSRDGVADYIPSLRVIMGEAGEARQELLEPLAE
jgi:hypothetical protein